MNLVDILPVEQWADLEREIHDRFGLDAYVYNTEGMSITEFKKWANRLCPVIKANDKGLSFICAVANQNLANEAIRKKRPVIGECDAGLLKVAVPIFVGNEFVGVAGGCGLILEDGEVESFLINKITDIDEKEIERLSDDIRRMTNSEAEQLTQHVGERIKGIVGGLK